VIMNSNGYINATKLCKNGGKEFKHWKESQHSKKMIIDFANNLEITEKEIMILVCGGSMIKISGTYVHMSLIVHIAAWCNNNYAYMVSNIVREFVISKKLAKIM
jgi:hypothetical protein